MFGVPVSVRTTVLFTQTQMMCYNDDIFEIIHSMHYSYNQSHIPTNAPNGIKTYVWFIILLYPFVGIYIIDYFEHILRT